VLRTVCPGCSHVGTERVTVLPRFYWNKGTPAKLYRLRRWAAAVLLEKYGADLAATRAPCPPRP